MKGYKVLFPDLRPCNGGTGRYVLDEWMPLLDGTELYERGLYHFCRDERDLLHWLGERIHPCETRGLVIEGGDKAGARQIKVGPAFEGWNERTARLFACDCAERGAYLDGTGQSARTIEVARRYANGDASKKELDAARAEAWAATGAGPAWAATGADAWAAARAAATAAAGAMSRGAERQWQAKRLKQYLKTLEG